MSTSNLIQNNAFTLAKNHYENFPVIPFFLPKKYREPIALIYAFARTADDIADEGDLDANDRLEKLHYMDTELILIQKQNPPQTPFFRALSHIIYDFNLPVNLFHDLLIAFKQDVLTPRYETYEDILHYCRHSANPIGRLLLILTHNDSEKNLKYSDNICTALQLINFLQDVASDLAIRNRLYFPLEDMHKYKVTESDLHTQRNHQGVSDLIDLSLTRASNILDAGIPLTKALQGRFGYNIRLTVQGGKQILKKLKKRTNPFERPTLNSVDWISMLLNA